MPNPPEPAAAPRAASKARALLLLTGLLVVLSSLRIWQLDLDPPETVVRGYRGQAHFRDEAAKAHEARNMAKWDRWSLSEADEYEFWRAQSPAWVHGERWWFEAFGVGVVEARAFVVVHTIVALALIMWLALIRHGLPAAIAVGLLLGLNWGYLVYSRLALMEGALLCWLLVATLALAQIDRRPREFGRWIALAVVAMFIACTIKQTGLLVVPAFALALVLLGLRASGTLTREALAAGLGTWLKTSVRARATGLALLGVASLAVALALLIFNPEYQERLAFNAEHFTAARDEPVLGQALQTLVRGLFGWRIQLMFSRLAPLSLWLGTLELARMLWVEYRRRLARMQPEQPRRLARLHALAQRYGAAKPGDPVPGGPLFERPDAVDLWMLAWGLLALLANLASPHRAIRFALVLLPPAAWLGAALVGRLWTHAYARPRIELAVRTALLGLLVIGVAATGLRFFMWTRDDQRSAAQIGAQLEALIGEREAVVIGEFAAQAVFETDYWHFYVRPNQFNTDDEVLDALGVTHLVVGEEDFVEAFLLDKRRDMLVGRRKLGEVVFRERNLSVWELASPDERAEIARANEREQRQKRKRKRKPKRKIADEPKRVRDRARQQ